MQIEPFGSGVGSNQDIGFFVEMFLYRALAVEIGIGLRFGAFLFPRTVNLIGLRIEIVTVQHDHPELLSE